MPARAQVADSGQPLGDASDGQQELARTLERNTAVQGEGAADQILPTSPAPDSRAESAPQRTPPK